MVLVVNFIGGKGSDGSAQVEDIEANIIVAMPKAMMMVLHL